MSTHKIRIVRQPSAIDHMRAEQAQQWQRARTPSPTPYEQTLTDDGLIEIDGIWCRPIELD